jgi:lipopolysaccharide export LptBFGC system permease protein LptF
MYLAFGIVVFISIIGLVIISYLEYKADAKQNEELKKNMNKHITRTGALENDRIHERTTIPKR